MQLHCMTRAESKGGSGVGSGGGLGRGETAFSIFRLCVTRKAEEPRCMRGFVAER